MAVSANSVNLYALLIRVCIILLLLLFVVAVAVFVGLLCLV